MSDAGEMKLRHPQPEGATAPSARGAAPGGEAHKAPGAPSILNWAPHRLPEETAADHVRNALQLLGALEHEIPAALRLHEVRTLAADVRRRLAWALETMEAK